MPGRKSDWFGWHSVLKNVFLVLQVSETDITVRYCVKCLDVTEVFVFQ